MILFDVLVSIPTGAGTAGNRAAGKQLYEPHSLFQQSPAEQTASAHVGGPLVVDSIRSLGRGGLVVKAADLGNGVSNR